LNAVEIEEAITHLAEQPFDTEGGVLQRSNIHIAVCGEGDVTKTLGKLKASPTTSKAKAKFVLATDGIDLEAEEISSGETIACDYPNFPDHFGFFLSLAGITTVKQIRESAFDIKATERLNRLYVELLKDNPEWGMAERRHDMNHFMARLIFCFFAEDTDIFNGNGLFTQTIGQMSARDSSDTHHIIGEIFRAMDTPIQEREKAKLSRWADGFPYVNGGLYAGNTDAPRFSKIARSYLIHIGSLDFRYSNTLGWNTFPVPKLTEENKADLTRCTEDILLSREAHFPATIADL